MRRALGGLALAWVLLTKPDGGPVWIKTDNAVAILTVRGGAAPTAIVTMAGTFYVREAPATAAQKLGWQK